MEPLGHGRGKKRARCAVEHQAVAPKTSRDPRKLPMPARTEPAGPENPKTAWNPVSARRGEHQQCGYAHDTGTGPAECLLQSTMAEVDGDRKHDADYLQQQQDPVGNGLAIKQAAQGKQHRRQCDTVKCQRYRHLVARRATIAAGMGTSRNSAAKNSRGGLGASHPSNTSAMSKAAANGRP